MFMGVRLSQAVEKGGLVIRSGATVHKPFDRGGLGRRAGMESWGGQGLARPAPAPHAVRAAVRVAVRSAFRVSAPGDLALVANPVTSRGEACRARRLQGVDVTIEM